LHPEKKGRIRAWVNRTVAGSTHISPSSSARALALPPFLPDFAAIAYTTVYVHLQKKQKRKLQGGRKVTFTDHQTRITITTTAASPGPTTFSVMRCNLQSSLVS
jgi:hypothetical protein